MTRSRITPGADDNASGLAGLLEIARYGWRQIPQNRSVLLFWIGNRGGSRSHVAQMISHRNERLAGVLVFRNDWVPHLRIMPRNNAFRRFESIW
jgi:hypothetical protein